MGQTALHWAAKRGFLDIAKLLLEKGASIKEGDIMGRTPKVLAQTNRNQDLLSVNFF